MSFGYLQEAEHLALGVLDTGKFALSSRDMDMKAVHAWTNEQFGVVLLVAKTGYRGTWTVSAKRAEDEPWRVTGGGGDLLVLADDVLADPAPEPTSPEGYGLERLGGGRAGIFRYTRGIAAKDVVAIRRRSDRRVSEIPLGCSRQFVVGTTDLEPIAYAIGLDDAGNEIRGSRLRL